MEHYSGYKKNIGVVFLIVSSFILQPFTAREYVDRTVKRDSMTSSISAPIYKKLKNLYLDTKLVDEGKPAVIIVAPSEYASEGQAIKEVIRELTGVTVPVWEDYPEEKSAFPGDNLILLGNRSTNPVINILYDRAYTFLDLKYPGVGGYVVRSLHNPSGNGRNVLFVGGSDLDGVKAATASIITSIGTAGGRSGKLSVNYLADIKLGKNYRLPDKVEDAEIWDASEFYKSSGYFGWNIISKNMALFYMTGEERFLGEFLRLSFPDSLAIGELEMKDGERIENKKQPLSGPYHYSAHMMIEMWDLIEESPLLTDEQRLKITNAFAQQLRHRVAEYGSIFEKTTPPNSAFNRHYDWAAFSLYALARYFEKDYPDSVWKQCTKSADLYFSAVKKTYWAAGNNDHLFWFTSYYDPFLDYLLFSGKRDPEMMTNLRQALNTQQVISTGLHPDWGLKASSLSMLNKAAYLLNDSRWLYYRKHINLDTDVFRLGQSFWPDTSTLKPIAPVDLVGVWNVQQMSKEMWETRNTDFPLKQSFRWGSYRSELGAGGDYILLKGYNGAGRNPYHTFDILELRLNGSTLMKGYYNQVLTSADGIVEPKVAMDAELLYNGVVGQTVTAVGRVPNLAFVDWRRSLALRREHYVLIADELEFRNNSENIFIETSWQMPEAKWLPRHNVIRIHPKESNEAVYELHSSEKMEVKGDKIITMNWHGVGRKGQKRIFFHLLGQNLPGDYNSLANFQLANNAAVLALPEAAVAAIGKYKDIEGNLVLLSEKALYGHAIRAAGLTVPLMAASSPVEIDWNFKMGKLVVVADKAISLSLALKDPGTMVLINEQNRLRQGKASGGLFTFELPAGKQEFAEVFPSEEIMKILASQLSMMLKEAQQQLRPQQQTQPKVPDKAPIPALPTVMQTRLGGNPANSIIIPTKQGESQLGIAVENTITILNAKGQEVRKLSTPGKIRVLHWWTEPKLLLAGCEDEKVIAFDEQGNKKWEFTSLMDSAVYEAGKQYWFKSAYPGIYGLYSGYFDAGKSRAFVGSAGTIEILDYDGQLVKRTPVFWGNPRQFLIVNAPDGSKNLLAARWRSDRPNLAVINSKTMKVDRYGYEDVPSGHTRVGGFGAMNRFDNFYIDMDGVGEKEIVSAINGTWNRVSIYSEGGKPLYNVQIGPGTVEPRSNIRMMDVGDLTGDGKPEILLGLSSGLVDVLDGQTNLLWSKLLPSAPVVVKLVRDIGVNWVCVGSEDGTIWAIDANGNIIKRGKVNGRPKDLQVIQTPKGQMAVITTDTGDISGFRIDVFNTSPLKK